MWGTLLEFQLTWEHFATFNFEYDKAVLAAVVTVGLCLLATRKLFFEPLRDEVESVGMGFTLCSTPRKFEQEYERTTSTENKFDGPKTPELPSAASVSHLIRKRRSIFPKDFLKGSKVPLRIVREMMAAANWAPTHGKTEPWRFAVVGAETMKVIFDIRKTVIEKSLEDDADAVAAFRKKMVKKEKELENVSVVIFVCMKRILNRKEKLMPEWEEIAATSMAVQNMHLQLTTHWDEGYGGYWSSSGWNGWLQDDQIKALLGMEGSVDGEHDKILGAFYLGQADPKKMDSYRSSRGDVNDKVKWLY
jgi:nitroreductase